MVEPAVGALVGAIAAASGRPKTSPESPSSLALMAYGSAIALDANEFVAAFCGGLAFGATAGKRA